MTERLILPAPTDAHVHFREPGSPEKEDFETGTMAAVAGGFTTILEMPNNPTRPTISPERLKEKIDLATGRVYCDVGFFFGAIPESVKHFRDVLDRIFGIKIYEEETTGELLVNKDKDLEYVIANCDGSRPIPVHASGLMLKKSLELAKRYNKWIHACHVATEEGILMIKKAKEDGIRSTCEVTPHHLFLTQDDLSYIGSYGVMKPPLATKRDQQALWNNMDVVDIIATDHAPHQKEKDMLNPPSGTTGLETAIPLLLTAVNEGRLTKERLIELICTNPRRIYGIRETPDTYTEVDMNGSYVIDAKNFKSKAKWSAFDGARVTGRIRKVVLRDNIVFDGDSIRQPASGRVIYPKF